MPLPVVVAPSVANAAAPALPPTPVVVAQLPTPTPAPTPAPTLAPTPAASATPPDADERAKRYAEAQKHPVVQELIKRFEADIVAREPGNQQAWEERMRRG